LLTTDNYAFLLAISAVGSLDDRAANVLTKLYATRLAGPGRVRYLAVNRVVANAGWALGGLATAAALTIGTTGAYQWILVGASSRSSGAALLTSAAVNPRRLPARSSPRPALSPRRSRPRRGAIAPTWHTSPPRSSPSWTTTPCSRSGLPLWIVHVGALHDLAPLPVILNNVMVAALQVPLARFGTATSAARALLLLSAASALGGATMVLSAIGGNALATVCLTASAVVFTLAEMLHATVSWELSVALAPTRRKAPTSASTDSHSRSSAAPAL
jgi:hypothetical protein